MDYTRRLASVMPATAAAADLEAYPEPTVPLRPMSVHRRRPVLHIDQALDYLEKEEYRDAVAAFLDLKAP